MTMYYVMQCDSSASSRFIRFRENEPEDDGRQWINGKAFETPPAGVVLSSKNENRLPFSEFALNDIDLHVYSPKMRQVLQDLGISGPEKIRRTDKLAAIPLTPLPCASSRGGGMGWGQGLAGL